MNIPDHPDIQRMEREGVPDADPIYCPICGGETDEFYKNRDGEIVGCFNCIERVDAWECVEPTDDYDEEEDFGSDDDVFYGSETDSF